MPNFTKQFIILASLVVAAPLFAEPVTTDRVFAPSENWIKPSETGFRSEICLNGSWQFQAMSLPGDFQWNKGTPPKLEWPKEDAWEKTPIKIPSPWNVNTWGNGRNVGEGTTKPYWPDSVYYPSYPEHWDHVQMAWMRRTVDVPADWKTRRVLLHFEAVGGMAEVYVNGVKVGENFGRFLPFELDVTEAMKPGEGNEILVGVRSLRLFDKISEKYQKMRTPYPPGSNMDNVSGIWQDVFLLAVPMVRIDDVFVKPFVHRDALEIEVTLKNDTEKAVAVEIAGDLFPWKQNDQLVFSLSSEKSVEIPPGESAVVTLSAQIGGKLKLWTMDEPNLYNLVLGLSCDEEKCDAKYTRFGWREWRIVGKELQLNGKPVQLVGDLLHPFGPFISSRDYVKAWYTMVKDMHGNAVRPHAQPHPRIYAELADELGIAVLAETALFGSSIQLNFEEPEAWDRFAEHYRKLILRDRNHPSIFGWSWGNELFAIFIYDKNITPEQTKIWWDKLAAYGKEGEKFDPTRNWFSCDGDGDVNGTSLVWNKHTGHGLRDDNFFPKPGESGYDKPWMVGEQGGTYYAKPGQLAEFNGNRAYENYRGRNEALAIDVYQNIVKFVRPKAGEPKLVFFSPAETAWFGLEHLPFGYNAANGDSSRLPNKNDGIFFKDFEEGKPGVQIERLPPYVCTFNPGWDKTLPLYKPLPMFEAQKAALDPAGAKPSEWDHKQEQVEPSNVSISKFDFFIDQVLFLGDMEGELATRLKKIGVPLVTKMDNPSLYQNYGLQSYRGPVNAAPMIIVDGNSYTGDWSAIEDAQKAGWIRGSNWIGTTVILMFREQMAIPLSYETMLGKSVLTKRTATQLKPIKTNNYSAGQLYFAEEPGDRHVIKCGLDGDIVHKLRILYEAADVDWSLFNESPEAAKCAAICLHEALKKPSGVAFGFYYPENTPGSCYVSTIDVIPTSPNNVAFWKDFFEAKHVKLDNPKIKTEKTKQEHNLLMDGSVE